mmetsp:Transcript_75923/g.126409  ORF Transcript_75923/g.126409 Transcript_75923/m.126409 type:complete len:134 (-) Transcript_75923:28-429(-)
MATAKLPSVPSVSTPRKHETAASEVPQGLPALKSGRTNMGMSAGLPPSTIRALAEVFAPSSLCYAGELPREELVMLLDDMGYLATGADLDTVVELMGAERHRYVSGPPPNGECRATASHMRLAGRPSAYGPDL